VLDGETLGAPFAGFGLPAAPGAVPPAVAKDHTGPVVVPELFFASTRQ
jgi:hypothetical protein